MTTLFGQVTLWGAALTALYGFITAVSVLWTILKRRDEPHKARYQEYLRQKYRAEERVEKGIENEIRLLRDRRLGIRKPYFIAEEGAIKKRPKGLLGRFGEPSVILVKPYNAVVLERSSRISRIEGPGVIKLQNEEELKAVIDLRPQSLPITIPIGEGALTKDNVPLAVRGSIAFRIESAKEAGDRSDRGDFETNGFTGIISGPYPVYRRTLYRAVYGVKAGKDWQSQTTGMAAGRVGAAIRGLRVDEIFVVDENERVTMERSALLDIIDQARPKAAETGPQWGVSVTGLNIFSIEMPEEAQEEFLRRWAAPWRGWQALMEAEAKRRAAITGAEGEQEVTRLQADAERWKIVTEALARLEAKEHEIEADKRVAQSKREIAEITHDAVVAKAQAQSDSQRLRARASAEAEAAYLRHLAEALLEILGEEGIRELLVEMVRGRFDLHQMRRLASIMDFPSQRALLGGGLSLSEWGAEERSREEERYVEE